MEALITEEKKFYLFCMSPVTCHLPPTPTATVRDPPPANFSTMQNRLGCKDPKTPKSTKPTFLTLSTTIFFASYWSILELCSETRSLQYSRKWGFHLGTNKQTDGQQAEIATNRLNWLRGLFSENKKMFLKRKKILLVLSFQQISSAPLPKLQN